MSMAEIRAVSIAAPAFNEAAGIRETVCLWLGYLRHYPGVDNFEIVVCNDGSQRSTPY
jgi:glycosyltransferase involved in cell wall biosynthesis